MRHDRPFSAVPPPQQVGKPNLPPSRRELLRRRLGRLFFSPRYLLFIGLGILIGLGSFLAYDKTRPLPQRMTQEDVDAAVERILASVTPQPCYASQVFEVIRPSLGRVQTRILTLEGKTDGALGTGVIIDDSGAMLTSLHVVDGAQDVRVVFSDGSGEIRSASVCGTATKEC